MMHETTDRQKIEIGGLPLRIAGVTIRLVELDRRNQAAYIVAEVDVKPQFLTPSEALMNRQA